MLLSKTRHTDATRFSDRQQRFYDFLKDNPVGVLSTVTPNADPHGVVIYFDIGKDFVASFVTHAETKKHDNIKHNNHVMLTVFEPKTQAVAQISGLAIEVEDSYEVNGIAAAILRASMKTSDVGLPPVSKLHAGPFVAYRIIPKQVRMAVYARPDSGEYADLFESIESFELEEVAAR